MVQEIGIHDIIKKKNEKNNKNFQNLCVCVYIRDGSQLQKVSKTY